MRASRILGNIGKAVLGATTGGFSDRLFDMLESRGMSEQPKAELVRIREANQAEIHKLEQEAGARVAEAAAKVVIAESQSQSWLPRNARPLQLTLLGGLMVLNYLLPLVAHVAGTPLCTESMVTGCVRPLNLPEKFFDAFMVFGTGYVFARSFFDKWMTARTDSRKDS